MNQNLKKIVTKIRDVAQSMEVSPSTLTKSVFFKNNDDESITEWELRKFGGFASILKTHFPVSDLDLTNQIYSTEVRSYIKRLEKELGNREFKSDMVVKAVVKKLQPVLKIKHYNIPYKMSDESREMTVMFNDMHYGLIVDYDEVGGVNSYSWKEAARRTAFIVKETCRYKRDKRKYVKRLNVIINGDTIQGVIHDLTARTAELMVYQVNGASHILGHAISRFAENFNEIVVYLITGNHEDQPHRRESGHRVTSHPYDSFCNMVGFTLSAMFRDTPNVKFVIPKTPYVYVNTLGGRIMVAHGDKTFSKALGNPGRNINVKSLSDEIHRFNNGEITKGEKSIKMVMMGHVHSHASFTTHDGVLVYIAPSLSGVDSYSHNTLSINKNIIGQVMFETTKDYIFGDSRLIQPNSADNDESLDKIIPPYRNSLKWEK